jgi:hypothetical protein
MEDRTRPYARASSTAVYRRRAVTGASASVFRLLDPTISTGVRSNKSFGGASGDLAQATTINELQHKLREPAQSVHIVPQVQDSLLSRDKCADADYIDVYDKHEVNYYDAMTTMVTVSNAAVLTGWRCTTTGLWRVPLVTNRKNYNVDTLLINHPSRFANLNSLYDVQTSKSTRQRVRALLDSHLHGKTEIINDVYELLSIEQTIRYLHAAAGHPTKHSWLKAIARGNYNSWPLVNIRNVRKHFPESEETQQGHMRGARQGVRSTSNPPANLNDLGLSSDPPPPDIVEKKNDIYIKVYELNQEDRLTHTMFSDQTGEVPYVSSRGNKYIMLQADRGCAVVAFF